MLGIYDCFGYGEGYPEDVKPTGAAELSVENIRAPVYQKNILSFIFRTISALPLSWERNYRNTSLRKLKKRTNRVAF